MEHLYNMYMAENFSGSFDTGKKFLGCNGDIYCFRLLLQAVIAHIALFMGVFLPEIAQQRNPPA